MLYLRLLSGYCSLILLTVSIFAILRLFTISRRLKWSALSFLNNEKKGRFPRHGRTRRWNITARKHAFGELETSGLVIRASIHAIIVLCCNRLTPRWQRSLKNQRWPGKRSRVILIFADGGRKLSLSIARAQLRAYDYTEETREICEDTHTCLRETITKLQRSSSFLWSNQTFFLRVSGKHIWRALSKRDHPFLILFPRSADCVGQRYRKIEHSELVLLSSTRKTVPPFRNPFFSVIEKKRHTQPANTNVLLSRPFPSSWSTGDEMPVDL